MAYQDHLPKCPSRPKAGVREGISRFAIPSSRVRLVFFFGHLPTEILCRRADKLEEKDYIQKAMEIGQREMDCIPSRLLLRGLNCGSDIISREVGIRIGLIRYVSLSVYSLLSPLCCPHLLLKLFLHRAALTYSLNGHSRTS